MKDLITGILTGQVGAIKVLLGFIGGLLQAIIAILPNPILDCLATLVLTLTTDIIGLLEPLEGCEPSSLLELIGGVEEAVAGVLGGCESCLQTAGCDAGLLQLILSGISGLVSLILGGFK